MQRVSTITNYYVDEGLYRLAYIMAGFKETVGFMLFLACLAFVHSVNGKPRALEHARSSTCMIVGQSKPALYEPAEKMYRSKRPGCYRERETAYELQRLRYHSITSLSCFILQPVVQPVRMNTPVSASVPA